MKNTHRQEPCWVNHPPSTGPTAAVMEVNPDQVPIARPRSSSEKLALISARLPGTSNAPPTPCTPLATISHRISGEQPHKAEAAEKSAIPTAKILRRPYKSPKTPRSATAPPETTRTTPPPIERLTAWREVQIAKLAV